MSRQGKKWTKRDLMTHGQDGKMEMVECFLTGKDSSNIKDKVKEHVEIDISGITPINYLLGQQGRAKN